MTVPMAYRRASAELDGFLGEVAERAGLSSRHQAYTVVDAVFRAFRRRLDPTETLLFAAALPPLLGGMFIQHWEPQPREENWDPAAVLRDVKALRPHHNLAGADAVSHVAAALAVTLAAPDDAARDDAAGLAAALARLPPQARAFWAGEGRAAGATRGGAGE
ncbi:DUF2267 domain-containing protein [Ancylobacter lacus]|uniref:DUF2267 domain-containing protein n=1 Tax=Ancylobacter lacus TaxID=2579970 RepID=UPI001BCE9828|nr:DUF2267 domain-containing protein [Ancylobacter lacus]MBS7537648.1 DUF2267 domain-containing protein [Ancylobacter lacus]